TCRSRLPRRRRGTAAAGASRLWPCRHQVPSERHFLMTVSIDAPSLVAESIAGRAKLVALVVAVSFFMQLLDSTIVITSLPQMAGSFGVEPVEMSIGLTVYMLTMAAFIPLAGWLGDRFGARNIFMAAIALFTIASVFCGLSDGLGAFIAARAVQGFAAALM